ncbi:helix-turn-helix domain-containing protein [Rhizomonospora bruguierae]|uniref:helix-turn-helix domain-containing protein n=1 Tax=Rhizomonospora bruguierae TaxID=1581705 RepID=UPI001BD1856A|nr:helix-turn-helix transcriptional regulator [Micromonospora sp. NBRC 107566]
MRNGYGATVAKRRLARRLGELRVANGYTANQVCDKLSWGRGKVGRFEANVWKRPEMSDIRDLLRLYDASDADRAELADLAVVARERAWWREYGDVFADSEYPGFEADARRIRLYMPLILPGLLQTPAYIEAQMRVGSQPTPWRRRAREARLRRQEILNREDGTAPELVAVITEAALLYRWGVRAERREQVEYLVDVARRPGVELRLLRFADGPHPGMSSLISVFDFAGDEPCQVFLENDVAIAEVTDRRQVDAYVTTFERIREAALDADATTEYLKHLVTTME